MSDHSRGCERIPLELRWEGKLALRWGLCLFRGRLRERECEAELRGTHSQAELGNDTGLMGALLPFVLRACCGSMCWPVDRPATHAAAGAAARGALIFCFGDSFTCSPEAAQEINILAARGGRFLPPIVLKSSP